MTYILVRAQCVNDCYVYQNAPFYVMALYLKLPSSILNTEDRLSTIVILQLLICHTNYDA